MTATIAPTSHPTIAELQAIVTTQCEFVDSAARNAVHATRVYDVTHDEADWEDVQDAWRSLGVRTERLAKRLGDLRTAEGKAHEDAGTEREICNAVAESVKDVSVKRAWHDIKSATI